jgi:uncharacterized protein (TIGR02246 family)
VTGPVTVDAGSAAAGSIERRLQRLEDMEEIRGLFWAYRRALDSKDFQAYAELFTTDGVFLAGDLQVTGHDEIRQLVQGMLGNLLGGEAGQDFHLVVNPWIELAGDEARADVTWMYVVRGADGQPRLAKLGHYVDTLVRDRSDGRWRFRRRSAPTDIPAMDRS